MASNPGRRELAFGRKPGRGPRSRKARRQRSDTKVLGLAFILLVIAWLLNQLG